MLPQFSRLLHRLRATAQLTAGLRAGREYGYDSQVVRNVNIADLKNNLSRYLRQVRRGEEILIRDRKVPVAKIVPLSAGEDNEELAQLAAEGLIRLREKELDIDEFWAMPGPRLPLERVVAAIVADREED